MVLVDDELQIRRGLMSLIPWDEYGIEIVGEADNGQTALDLIQNSNPDIAIMDIRMPKMDGLQLLEATTKLVFPPKCIMLSGYDQFEYVKKAMRLGALNYLLKPVDQEELKSTITETIATLHDEKCKKQQFNESMKILLNNTLNRLLTNRIEVHELREKCQLLDISLRCNNMSVGIIRPLFDNSDLSLRYIIFDALDICHKSLNAHFTAYPAADEFDNIAIIIKNPNGEISEKQILDIMADCASQIQNKLHINCLYTLGAAARSYKELPNSYQTALRTIEASLMWGEIGIQPDELVFLQKKYTPEINIDSLVELLQQGNEAEVRQYVHEFFHNNIHYGLSPMMVKFYVIELITYALQAANQCCIAETELIQLKTQIYEKIKSNNYIKELEQSVFDMLWGICQQIHCLNIEGYSQRIQYVVQYIHRHYNDPDLSLKTLAHKIDVNSAYLGRQFKLETGAFFFDYLNRIRIQRAKHLLASTPLRIAEVAERVGFLNVAYFSTLYKKFIGECPVQSRSTTEK